MKMMKKSVHCLVVALGITSLHYATVSYALEGEFVTIIGPDGHPMVVPLPPRKKAAPAALVQPPVAAVVEPTKPDTKRESIAPPATSVVTPAITPKLSQQSATHMAQQRAQPSSQSTSSSTSQSTSSPISQPIRQDKIKTANTPTRQVSNPQLNNQQPPRSQTQTATTDAPADYQVIEGEKYYSAEYLEQQQFNLDGKKRFYQIPNIGGSGANWDVVERTKGADMSWFRQSRSNKPDKGLQAIALGTQYAVLSQTDVAHALPWQCADAKSRQRAKSLDNSKSLDLFPRPGFNEQFQYQLIEMKQPVNTFSLMAFADREKEPRYYWPLVVFLDQQGCVIEGASAFYTQTHNATALQSAAIEGVLRVPSQSRYIMLTPLEHAVDLPDTHLSNQGQIKLTVLR